VGREAAQSLSGRFPGQQPSTGGSRKVATFRDEGYQPSYEQLGDDTPPAAPLIKLGLDHQTDFQRTNP
jgi:hypothetical protein